MDHLGLDGSPNCNDAAYRCNGPLDEGFNGWAENVQYKYSDGLDTAVAAGHEDWMNSNDHAETIMNPDNAAVGYGYYVCANGPDEELPAIYMTGLFAST